MIVLVLEALIVSFLLSDVDCAEKSDRNNDRSWECLSRIRVAMSLNPEFRELFQKLIKTSRLDQLARAIRSQAENLCSETAKIDVFNLMDQHKESAELVEHCLQRLTNDERDHLNVWSNLNDTDSQRQLLLAKLQELTPSKYRMIRKSLDKIVKSVFNAKVPLVLGQVLSKLGAKDFAQLKAFARESQTDSIKALVDEKVSMLGFGKNQVGDVSNFFVKTFQSVPSVTDFGTRQYQLQHDAESNLF